MPYISQDARTVFGTDTQAIKDAVSGETSPGLLNYYISTMLWTVFKRFPSYAKANEILGVLEAVKLEFYRRCVVPYEEEKIREHGDLEI